ncbi:MAG: hypothetical protein HQL29_05245 [Candidatus Omnitrophica bacterium]|nr:hypothetical protein [Candidatus Omnitrophota bacterium]
MKHKKNYYISLSLLAIILLIGLAMFFFSAHRDKNYMPDLENVTVHMNKATLYENYPKDSRRTYRKDGEKEWITFDHVLDDGQKCTLTFVLEKDEITGWRLDDREEVVQEYLGEFCSQKIIKDFPALYGAIKDVFMRLPQKAFLRLTDRTHPVIFAEVYSEGLGSLANSTNITILDDDPPTFTKGLYVTKLKTELDSVPKKAKAIIAHELAHAYLGHSGTHNSSNEEKLANTLVFHWGFADELKEALK